LIALRPGVTIAAMPPENRTEGPARTAARRGSRALAVILALGPGACRPSTTVLPIATVPVPGSCLSGPANPRVFIGPDVSLQVVCGEAKTVAVASVDQEGPGATSWSATLEGGDPFFTLPAGQFFTCAAQGPSVASVRFIVPPNATPGTVHDAVVAIRAVDDAFPAGTVKVHAEVLSPIKDVTPEEVEFGDVPAGQFTQRTVTFATNADKPVNVHCSKQESYPFSFDLDPRGSASTQNWAVTLLDAVPGDYTVLVDWDATIDVPSACEWTKTGMRVHARVLAPGESSTGDADAGDVDAGAGDAGAGDGGAGDAGDVDSADGP
jgi:hypothetical protein